MQATTQERAISSLIFSSLSLGLLIILSGFVVALQGL